MRVLWHHGSGSILGGAALTIGNELRPRPTSTNASADLQNLYPAAGLGQ